MATTWSVGAPLIDDDRVLAAFALEDAARPESAEAIAELHRLGVTNVVMVTGDARSVAEHVGQQIGVDEVHAEVLPEDKDRTVIALREQGRRVAMVGDGVNDAPGLARADVGLAIGAGTDVAIESAGMVFAGSDPRAVGAAIRLSRASCRKMWQNLIWAAGYNIIAIPVAAGAFVWAGITMPPSGCCNLDEPLHRRGRDQRPTAPQGRTHTREVDLTSDPWSVVNARHRPRRRGPCAR